jgi:hypothetical protein
VGRERFELSTNGLKGRNVNRNALILLHFLPLSTTTKWRTLSNNVAPKYANLPQGVFEGWENKSAK